MRIQADEKIQQQLDVCLQRAIYEKIAKPWLHPFIFSGKKVEDSNSMSVRTSRSTAVSTQFDGRKHTPWNDTHISRFSHILEICKRQN